MASSELLLFDTASLYFRAFYALPSSMRARDGRPVNAVRGLLEFLARFIGARRPSHIACCWDVDWRPSWRVELVPSYKAHRVLAEGPEGSVEETPAELDHQVGWILDVLAALGIPVVGAPDAEADDVIGTLTTAADIPVTVVTGDRDLFQLVNDERRRSVLYVGAGMKRSDLVTDVWLEAKYGIAGAGYADFALLRGDASDGLPGVQGVGEKTAAQLVAAHGDLEGILRAAGAGLLTPALTARLTAAVDYLAAARDVVRVRCDLPGLPGIDALEIPAAPADAEELDRLAGELDLGGAATRIRAALWP